MFQYRIPMHDPGRDDKEIAWGSLLLPSVDDLCSLPGEVEDELGVVVLMRFDLCLKMAVQLQLAQDEAQRVYFDLLN